nr:hypothetical protein [Angustibacter aerolatus]
MLPGALYTWSVEREDGPWAVGFADRLYRFVGASAAFGAVFAWPLYAAYGRFVVTGDLRAGRPLPWWTWFAVLGYVGVPVVTGALVGLGRRRGWAWVRPLTGPENVPRGWDQPVPHPRPRRRRAAHPARRHGARGGVVAVERPQPPAGQPRRVVPVRPGPVLRRHARPRRRRHAPRRRRRPGGADGRRGPGPVGPGRVR